MAISAVTTRRAFLHALPAATIALGTPALASTSLPDPVFAAIAQREAVRDFINSGVVSGDDSVDDACHLLEEAENQLAHTPPETVEGVAALLRVFRRDVEFQLEGYPFERFLLALVDNAVAALEAEKRT